MFTKVNFIPYAESTELARFIDTKSPDAATHVGIRALKGKAIIRLSVGTYAAAPAVATFASSSSVHACLGMGRYSWNKIAAAMITARIVNTLT